MDAFWDFLKVEQLSTIFSFLSLATTVYFTKTLVGNDNKREKRAEAEKEERRSQEIIDWCINEWNRCGLAQGLIQNVGNELVRKFGKDKINIIVKSYEIYANQNREVRAYQRREFLYLMREKSTENQAIWPEF